jgi:hypothetical protein
MSKAVECIRCHAQMEVGYVPDLRRVDSASKSGVRGSLGRASGQVSRLGRTNWFPLKHSGVQSVGTWNRTHHRKVFLTNRWRSNRHYTHNSKIERSPDLIVGPRG